MVRYLLLALCFLITSPILYAQTDDSCNQRKCIAVVDAGSTGSRLHLYAYDLDETNTPIRINEIFSNKAKPGFATIEPNKESIKSYLDHLFAGTTTTNTIPVYFYATAGMRLVPPNKQKSYYQELSQWFSQQSKWQLIDAKTITGNDEGFYDWLSVNYHLGAFKTPQTKAVGVMDMGGASVQIVFPTQPNATDINQKKVHLYGQDITLSVHSFLGLGQTEVSHQFLDSTACFSNDFPLPDGQTGQGNARVCEQEVSPLMNAVHGVNNNIQPLLTANPVDSWYAIGGISNLADNKLFHFENNQLTLKGLLNQADAEFCHQPWDKLEAQFPGDGYIYGYCLFSAYYYALIVDGYGLSPEQPVNYLPPKLDIDWTLGVVLDHSSSKAKSVGFNG